MLTFLGWQMRIRHKNMLDRANFLVTKAEPKVVSRTEFEVLGKSDELTDTRQYFRPWDLRAAEEDRIDEQIKETQALIGREVEEFEARLPRKQTILDDADGNTLTQDRLQATELRN